MKHNIGVSSIRGANCFRDAQKFFYLEVAALQFDNLCLCKIKLSDEKKDYYCQNKPASKMTSFIPLKLLPNV